MKDIINVIIGNEDITVLEKYRSDNEEVFTKYMDIVKEMISLTQKVYKKGLSLEQLIELVKFFFEEYNQNVILISYYKNNVPIEEMKEEVKKIIERYLTKIDSSITLEDEDIDAAFSNVSGVSENKTLTLSNGHPTGTETGFIAPFILAILTATIEITSLLYIFIKAME